MVKKCQNCNLKLLMAFLKLFVLIFLMKYIEGHYKVSFETITLLLDHVEALKLQESDLKSKKYS